MLILPAYFQLHQSKSKHKRNVNFRSDFLCHHASVSRRISWLKIFLLIEQKFFTVTRHTLERHKTQTCTLEEETSLRQHYHNKVSASTTTLLVLQRKYIKIMHITLHWNGKDWKQHNVSSEFESIFEKLSGIIALHFFFFQKCSFSSNYHAVILYSVP